MTERMSDFIERKISVFTLSLDTQITVLAVKHDLQGVYRQLNLPTVASLQILWRVFLFFFSLPCMFTLLN